MYVSVCKHLLLNIHIYTLGLVDEVVLLFLFFLFLFLRLSSLLYIYLLALYYK